MDTARSSEERKARLDQYLFEKLADPNFSLVQQSEFRAMLKYHKKTNHVGHFLGSLFTFGFWLPIWFIITVTNRAYTKDISIDENGYISETRR